MAENTHEEQTEPQQPQAPLAQPQSAASDPYGTPTTPTPEYTQARPAVDDGIPDWMNALVIRKGGLVPSGISNWSWAGFFWNWIYFFVRGQWKIALAILGITILSIALNAFIPAISILVGIAIMLFSSMYGRKLAFVGAEPGKFPNDEALKKSDKPWIIAGIVLLVLGILATIFATALLVSVLGTMISSGTYNY